MTNVITQSIAVFHAADGTPLDNGKIYVGSDGLNPETNPVQVYSDSALSVTIAQPIRTVAGRPVNDNGAPTALYLSGDYSITVKDQNDQLISSELSIEAVGTGDMQSANNLSDVASIPTSRTNLGIPVNVINKSATYTAVAGDRSKVIRGTATATLNLTAAATLGDGWYVRVFADGGDITVDPNGSETIDGSATLVIQDGESALIVCNGTAFFTDGLIALLDGKEPADSAIIKSDETKNVTKGYTADSYDEGTKSSGTFTPDPTNGNFQHYINGGAHTLAAPTTAGCYTIVPADAGVATDTFSYAGTSNPSANVMGIAGIANPTVAMYAIWEAGNTTPSGSFSGDGNDPVTGTTTLTSDDGTNGIVCYFKAQDAAVGFDITADVGDIGVQASASGFVDVS